VRRRSLFALIVAAVVVLGGGAYAAEHFGMKVTALGAGTFVGPSPLVARSQPSASPSTPPPPPPSPSPSPSATDEFPTLRAPADPSDITVSGTTLFGWAFYDRATHKTTGSKNYTTVRNTTESMIKAWIAGDYLRRQTEAGKTPTKTALSEITLMIIDSNDDMAQKYYALDGYNDVINRLIKMCGLKNVTIRPYYWSWTQMSPADAVRYGTCVADGRAAGPRWTKWLLDTMKKIRGGVQDQISVQKQGGHWGIIDGLPTVLKPTVSWKNGWTLYVDGWHVNCMGISDKWVLVIEVRIGTLQKAANVCASVTRQLVVTS
jgi:hypothetical protein